MCSCLFVYNLLLTMLKIHVYIVNIGASYMCFTAVYIVYRFLFVVHIIIIIVLTKNRCLCSCACAAHTHTHTKYMWLCVCAALYSAFDIDIPLLTLYSTKYCVFE